MPKINLKSFLILTLTFLSCRLLAENHQPGLTARPRLNIWIHGTAHPVTMCKKAWYREFGEDKLLKFADLRPNGEAYRTARALNQGNMQDFALPDFHFFRWTGLLDYKKREKASMALYHALKKEIQAIFLKTGQKPFVTIITHSHGGNIALNLAQINEQNEGDLQVDRLILLACPVQDRTAKWSEHHTFNKIYAFYSSMDMIQVLAINNLKLAGRRFGKNNDKITHVKTSWKHYGLMHNDFKGEYFVAKLPGALKQIDYHINLSKWSRHHDYFLKLS